MRDEGKPRVLVVGLRGQGSKFIEQILDGPTGATITCLCDVLPHTYPNAAQFFQSRELQPPPYERDLDSALSRYGEQLDVAIIATPPVFHFEQSTTLLEAGLDLIVEKQMTETVYQAREIVRICKETGLTLSVGYQFNFSQAYRIAREILGSGEMGEIQAVQAAIWQNWKTLHSNEWRMNPEIAVGGFVYDVASHVVNAVCQMTGQELGAISAEFDHQGTAVEVNAAIRGRLRSRTPVSILAAGNTVPPCASEVRLYLSHGILRTNAWGEWLEIMPEGSTEWQRVDTGKDVGIWEQFLRVARGLAPNPSPPELGVRMAIIWDAIKRSADNHGAQVLL